MIDNLQTWKNVQGRDWRDTKNNVIRSLTPKIGPRLSTTIMTTNKILLLEKVARYTCSSAWHPSQRTRLPILLFVLVVILFLFTEVGAQEEGSRIVVRRGAQQRHCHHHHDPRCGCSRDGHSGRRRISATATACVVIRIGTRPSPLARVQTEAVAKKILSYIESDGNNNNNNNTPPRPRTTTKRPTIEIVDIHASGDFDPSSSSNNNNNRNNNNNNNNNNTPLAYTAVDFAGALDDALCSGEIDIAVHSLKDIPPSHRWKNQHLMAIAGRLPRHSNPFDALILPWSPSCFGGESNKKHDGKDNDNSLLLSSAFQHLPYQARVGTSSIRRQAQLLSIRPDTKVVNIRGNVHARLDALKEGRVDALVLAAAGLQRLLLVEEENGPQQQQPHQPKRDLGGSILDSSGSSGSTGTTTTSSSGSAFLPFEYDGYKYAYKPIPGEEMLPGICQGVVAAVCRAEDSWIRSVLDRGVDDHDTKIASIAERAFLDVLDKLSHPWAGRPPLAAFMEKKKNYHQEENNDEDDDHHEKKKDHCWMLQGMLASPDGSKILRASATTIDINKSCSKEEEETLAKEIGYKVANDIAKQAGSNFFRKKK